LSGETSGKGTTWKTYVQLGEYDNGSSRNGIGRPGLDLSGSGQRQVLMNAVMNFRVP